MASDFPGLLTVGCGISLVLVVLNSAILEIVKEVDVDSPPGMHRPFFLLMYLYNALLIIFHLLSFHRFAEFVEGKSHLSDREVLDYETSTLVPSDNMTDDESDEDY